MWSFVAIWDAFTRVTTRDLQVLKRDTGKEQRNLRLTADWSVPCWHSEVTTPQLVPVLFPRSLSWRIRCLHRRRGQLAGLHAIPSKVFKKKTDKARFITESQVFECNTDIMIANVTPHWSLAMPLVLTIIVIYNIDPSIHYWWHLESWRGASRHLSVWVRGGSFPHCTWDGTTYSEEEFAKTTWLMKAQLQYLKWQNSCSSIVHCFISSFWEFFSRRMSHGYRIALDKGMARIISNVTHFTSIIAVSMCLRYRSKHL